MSAVMEIKRSPRGYYVLTVDGKFFGNYDTVSEAMDDYDETERTSSEKEKAS